MNAIKRSLWGVMLLPVALWLWAEPMWQLPPQFFPWRNGLIQLGGLVGMVVMSVAMLLAWRPRWLESPLGGLDKMYRLHKWLGIAGLVLAVSHWLLAKAPKWLVEVGLMARGQRPRRPEGEVLPPLAQWLQDQRHLAEEVGEWAFYGAAVLIVIALIRRFPYRLFFQTHRLLPLAYLALVFHSVILFPRAHWGSAAGALLAVLLLAGSGSALVSLLRARDRARRVPGAVAELAPHAQGQVLQVDVQLEGGWPGHQAGQFAFLTLDPQEGPHPFTIASAWTGNGRLRFAIKALGDYTARLPQLLQVGQPVTVEGPYGRFDFGGPQTAQVWVAGGIGITPFLARLQARADHQASTAETVDLFYCTRVSDEAFLARLQDTAERARVRLHLVLDGRDERLTAERLCEAVPDWREASVWFCGPAAFGQGLHQGLLARGLPAGAFHQELFEMR